MFDPTLRQQAAATNLGPLSSTEVIEFVENTEHDDETLLRFCMSINQFPFIRDLAFTTNRNTEWWVKLYEKIDGIDAFLPAVASSLAFLVYEQGDQELAKALVYKVIKVDSQYSLALLLIRAMTMDAPSKMLTNTIEKTMNKDDEKVKAQIEHYDTQVTDFRANHEYFKKSA